jgi:hypothetical protein
MLPPLAAAADGGVERGASFALGLPDKSWKLLVQLPGFEMGEAQTAEGGARAFGVFEPTGVAVSLTLARSPGDPSAKSCRDHDWAGRQRTKEVREDVRLSAEGQQARVEFRVPGVGGAQAGEKHVFLYLQRDGVCAIVHLTKLHYQPTDSGEMERLLATARIWSPGDL